MPNWCSCNLTVTGPSLDYFYDAMKGEFSFQKFVPEPEELRNICSGSMTIDGVTYRQWREIPNLPQEEFDKLNWQEQFQNTTQIGIPDDEVERLVKLYGSANRYDWHCANWGTKWDACEAEIDDMSDQSFSVRFDSAWSPPSQFLETVSALFPTLHFQLAYAEGGACFYGVDAYKAGERLDESFCDGEFWKPADEQEEEDPEDYEDNLTEECRQHINYYGLGTGG